MNKQFPKNIYQVWLQGYSKLENPLFKQNVDNWQLLNPEWKYIFLDDNLLRNGCEKYSKRCLEAYDKALAMHTKIDMGRMVYLYLYGGISTDIDMFILRKLDSSMIVNDIIEYYNRTDEHVIGLSRLNINFIESYFYHGNSKTYNNAVVIASPKHPIIKGWIDTMITNIFNQNATLLNDKINDFLYVERTSGPTLFNKYMNKHYESYSGKIVEIPHTVFEPCLINGKCEIGDDTITIHKFSMSWTPDFLKRIAIIYFNYKTPIILGIILLLLYIINRSFIRKNK